MINGIVAQGAQVVRGGGENPLPIVTPHRYWRVRFLETNGSSHRSIGELKFLNYNGTNMIGGGVPLASSIAAAKHDPTVAFDGIIDSRYWASATDSAPQYLGYDFGYPVAVVKVEITAAPSPGYPAEAIFTGFVESSDDNINWSVEWDIVNQRYWGASNARLFTNPAHMEGVGYAYWRILCTQSNTPTVTMINECEMREVANGPEVSVPAGNKNCISSGTYNGSDYGAVKAFDNTIGTTATASWVANTGVNAWLGYAYEQKVEIREVIIWPHRDNLQEMVKAFTVQCSDNPLTDGWIDVWSVADQVNWTQLTSRTFTRP